MKAAAGIIKPPQQPSPLPLRISLSFLLIREPPSHPHPVPEMRSPPVVRMDLLQGPGIRPLGMVGPKKLRAHPCLLYTGGAGSHTGPGPSAGRGRLTVCPCILMPTKACKGSTNIPQACSDSSFLKYHFAILWLSILRNGQRQ